MGPLKIHNLDLFDFNQFLLDQIVCARVTNGVVEKSKSTFERVLNRKKQTASSVENGLENKA